MVAAPKSPFQSKLQAAVQTVQWTYIIFWKMCPQQGTLVWSDGYYNGAIKTRKTVQPTEVSTEEASLQRSEQLKELYESLCAGGETNHQVRRPSAALSPEDLTESEWFYLMCVSFSFPPGVGLPGKAYAKRQHVWLTGASEVDNNVFSRAILAKTVVCIPLLDGVVELGTIGRVKEDMRIIQCVQSFFTTHQDPNPPRPALSEQSTSNPTITTYFEDSSPMLQTCALNNNNIAVEEEEEEDEDEDEDEDDEVESDSDAMTTDRVDSLSRAIGRPSELMQLDMSEDIRIGSPEDGSNNLDSDFHHLTVAAQSGNLAEQHLLYRAQSMQRLSQNDPMSSVAALHPPHSGFPSADALLGEDTHYSDTVSSILENQSNRWSNSSSGNLYSNNSAFSKWSLTSLSHRDHLLLDGASQCALKYILFTVPLLHTKSHDPSTRRDTTPHDELSANHVLAERRRREKLNEHFIILRSLVPFVTKMDKASILGDTIEYVKQLRKKIQELESQERPGEASNVNSFKDKSIGPSLSREKRKLRIVEGGGRVAPRAVAEDVVQVEVSIIETDALVEIQCMHKEGLLMDVMQLLRKVKIEVTTVQSSITDGLFTAELRAKVKENVNGRKASIMEVKRAINQIIIN
ncbi:hypothetical protein RD792_003347 [Penstemon davidsonii]|uniref:BHLH domain-containing protein n=1 Tax=Penstemon davidsonii TaxID=160366 RepID=A0ABR0DUG0_9LAMI|nr:hypothetical protein RD792_003347 [Penstemon davidsonii]